MLLAEELEIDLSKVTVVAAPVGEPYVNALNAGQVTGTSNSVQDAWEKLRKAGAQARMMLISAAAQMWQVKPSDCRAQNGRVIGPQGKTATYGQLAEAASKLPVPKDVPLKDATQFRLIGKSLPRLDTGAKVDGSAEFGLDVKLPGMLYAVVALSPTLGGKAISVDSSASQAMPGVRSVLTTSSGVVVIADHFWQARKARDALRINWDQGPNASLDTDKIWSGIEKTNAPAASALEREEVIPALKTGHTAEAVQQAAKSFSAVYQLPLLAHATMEPMNCTADVRADRCDITLAPRCNR